MHTIIERDLVWTPSGLSVEDITSAAAMEDIVNAYSSDCAIGYKDFDPFDALNVLRDRPAASYVSIWVIISQT